ncbi:MAG: sugar O-acetyltransferase [Pseudoflavonifractor sp.]|nr:sugar O-acetyltransferase [Pseudoflavonifractor sp.]
MTQRERMLAGQLYRADDPELEAAHSHRHRLVTQINAASAREELLPLFQALFGTMGESSWVEPPFHCDYGSHIRMGRNCYLNCDCILLDVCDITLGDNVLLAPRVCIFTATHPIDAAIRNSGLEYGKPVRIGNNVWIGGNTVVNPGVTIGDGTIVGSGSVVTKDLPAGVIAAGNPCRILRPITDADRTHWEVLAEQYQAEHP